MDISKLGQEINSQFEKISSLANSNQAESKKSSSAAEQVDRSSLIDSQEFGELKKIKSIVDSTNDVRRTEVDRIKKALSEGYEFSSESIAEAMLAGENQDLIDFLSN